jgi:hypothetical protein
MRAVLALALLAAAPPAAADVPGVRGAASLEYEAGYVHAIERARDATGVDGLALAGARLRGQAGGARLQYRAGLDLAAGATAPGGFAYDVNLYAAGVGVALGPWSRLGVAGGIGASGAIGTVDDALQLPVEASLELALGRRLRLLARGRVAWLAAADARQGGAASLPVGDQLDASVALRLGRRSRAYGYPVGNGYYLGAAYREAGGVRMLGVVIGHSIDMASR